VSEPAIHLAGTRCHTCARAMAVTLPEIPPAELATMTVEQISQASVVRAHCYQAVHRALWLTGALELAPGRWQCWVCSLENPGNRHAADTVQHRLSKPERVGFEAGREWGRR
jgi:hypothetical protein